MSTTSARAARLIKKVGAAGVLTLAALAFPAAAQAHHASVTVSCTEAVFTYEDFHFPGNATWEVKVDGTVVESGTHTFSTVNSVHTVPLTIYGKHTVTATTEWTYKGKPYGADTEQHVDCAEQPAPPAPPAPPAAASAPAVTPPAPASAVQGVQVSSPSPTRASLATRSSCTSKTVRATVNGRGMRRVTFAINGRVVRRVSVAAGRRTVTQVLPRRGNGVQALTVRVQYANRTQVLTARATRCAQAQVQPQFTG